MFVWKSLQNRQRSQKNLFFFRGLALRLGGASRFASPGGLGLSPAETVRVDLLGQFGDNAVGAGLQIALTL